MNDKLPLVLTPQPEGGYTVTSPLLPELVTEGDSIDEAMENVKDALAAVVEAYHDPGRPHPANAGIADVVNDADAAWAAEIQRRLDEIDAAQVKLISWDEARRIIRRDP